MNDTPLALDSLMWHALAQAYGSAEDVARLLAALHETEDDASRVELWFGAWATLYADGRVFTAAYAAVPHLLALTAGRALGERVEALHLVTSIEVARHSTGAPPIPAEIVAAYAAAIESLPSRVAELTMFSWDTRTAQVLAAALLVGKRQPALAAVLLEGPAEHQ